MNNEEQVVSGGAELRTGWGSGAGIAVRQR